MVSVLAFLAFGVAGLQYSPWLFLPGLAIALAAGGVALATVCPKCKGRPFSTPPLWPPQQFRYTCPHCRHDLYLK